MSKTTIRKGKQDDKFSLAIREIQSSMPENKKCFDCEQRGPTYVNITVGSFVCTKCSGMLRGMNPPHRIKSISMSTFTPDEVENMRGKGNLWCSRVWLGTYDAAANPMDYKDDEKIKDFMIQKYERKRYYVESNERSAVPRSSPSVSSLSSTSSAENKPLSSLIGTTLKAHIAAQGQTSGGGISLSRPAPSSLPRPQEMRVPPQPKVQHPAPPPVTAAAPPPATTSQQADFADFANFESVAFDSLPADPLTQPQPAPTTTLPPIRKSSQVMNNNQAEHQSTPVQKTAAQSQQDRYSALKELDDMFRTTTVTGPEPEINLFPSSSSAPTAIPNQSNGIFGGVESSHSPAFGRSSPAGWSSGPSAAAPAWTPTWNQASAGVGGWPATDSTGGWGSTSAAVSTNPFGTSPSGPPAHFNKPPLSENNNDLFAAAPKPFLSDKQGSNLWSAVPAFTPNMTPAPNPNNPFL